MIAAFGEILFDVYPDKEYLGGAPFNFIYHIHKLTGEGSIISRIGNDGRGKKIQQFLNETGMDQQLLQTDNDHATGTATVHIDSNGNPKFTLEENAAYDFIEYPQNLTTEIEFLYFGTLAQRSFVSRNTLKLLTEKAYRCFLDVNLRQQYYSREIIEQSFAFADIVKLNLEELHTIHPLFFTESFELRQSAMLFLNKFSLSHIAVTLGEEGSWLFTERESNFQKTTVKLVVDTVGAGDGFSAIICYGILKGLPMKDIHKAASEFSAALCQVKGALPNNDKLYEKYK